MPDFYDFTERLQFSEGVGLTEEMLRHVLEHVPAATGYRKAKQHEDKSGTDWWIDRKHGLPPVSIDLKNREICPIKLYGSDDICIETCSVYKGERRPPYTDNLRTKSGWTIDDTKRTDLVIYTWPHAADLLGGKRLRYWILYFPFLCSAAQKHWRDWAGIYRERATPNVGYVTLNTYVPRIVVAAAIREFSYGVLTRGHEAHERAL